jgi:hypothetical protein
MDAHAGRFIVPASGDTITITGLGFKPAIVILFAYGGAASTDLDSNLHYRFMYGAYDGSRNVCVSLFSENNVSTSNTSRATYDTHCLVSNNAAGGVGFSLVGGGFADDGFIINILDNPGADAYVNYLALGGVAAECGTFSLLTGSPGTQDVSLHNSFTPEYLELLYTRGAINSALSGLSFCRGVTDGSNSHFITGASANGVGTTQTATGNGTGSVIKFVGTTGAYLTAPIADISSFGPGKFTLNYSAAAYTAHPAAYIAIGAAKTDITVTTEPASGPSPALSTYGVYSRPKALLVMSTVSPSGLLGDHRVALGVSDGDRDYGVFMYDKNGVSTSYCVASTVSKVQHYIADIGVLAGDMSVNSFEDSAVVMEWSNFDTTARAYYGAVLSDNSKDRRSVEYIPSQVPQSVDRTLAAWLRREFAAIRRGMK